VAVAEAVAETLGSAADVEIKWPNDVLIGGLKTSGILMELGTEEARVTHAVLGIGVNLNVDPADFPDEFRGRATSLAAFAGEPVDRVAFTRRLYRVLEDVLDAHAAGGLDAIRPRLEPFFHMAGRRVTVHGVSGDRIEGTVEGLAPSGALRVRRADGGIETVLAGDVTLSAPDASASAPPFAPPSAPPSSRSPSAPRSAGPSPAAAGDIPSRER